MQEYTQANFLRILFDLLDDYAVRYCVLHSWAELPYRLASDLDIAVHPDDRSKLAAAITALSDAGYCPIQCFHYSIGAFYFVFAWHTSDGFGFGCVDMLFEHWRSGLLVSTAKNITASRRWCNGFWTASPDSELSYLLAKRTWKGTATTAQAQRIKSLVQTLGPIKAETLANDIFLMPWIQRVLAACLGTDLPSALNGIRRIPWLTAFAKHPLRLATFVARDVYRRGCRWIKPTGLLIAVLGTDGTGKSTLIAHLRSQFAPAFRRVKQFHWAPRLIVPRRDVAPRTNPHLKPARGAILSCCFLLTVVLDYWIGYLLSLRTLRARSGLILFDRYFHDLLIDPQRYRYGGPPWLARWMTSLVPPPDFVVTLDADERAIAERKGELPLEEISRQRQQYKGLQFPGSEWIVVNTEKGEESTLDDVSSAIIEHLARRFESRHPEAAYKSCERRTLLTVPLYPANTQRVGLVETALELVFGASGKETLDGANVARPCRSSTSASIAIRRGTPAFAARGFRERGYRMVRQFVVLPSHENPKWLLPYENRCAAGSSLRAYTSHSRPLPKSIATIAAALGWPWMHRNTILVASRQTSYFEAIAQQFAGQADLGAAIYFGAPGLYRKICVRWMRSGGDAACHLKLPTTGETNVRILHEAKVLDTLHGHSEFQGRIPQLIHSGAIDGIPFLLQSPVEGRPGPVEFGPCHEDFLQLLHRHQPTLRPGYDIVEEVADRLWRSVFRMGTRWAVLGKDVLRIASQQLRNASINCGLSHGDFTPWNTHLHNGRLSVFDWEASEMNAPHLWDKFHFLTQTRSLLRKGCSAGTPLDMTAEDHASYLLYLLDSAAKLAAEGTESNGVAHREEELLKQLRLASQLNPTLKAIPIGIGASVDMTTCDSSNPPEPISQ